MKIIFLISLLSASLNIVSVPNIVTNGTIVLSKSVRGRVTNTNGAPLAGAVITIANETKGTHTDKNGFYLLSDIPHESILVFMCTGYKTIMQPVPNEKTPLNQQLLNAQLEADRILLPPMGATAAYRAIKINKKMPAVATLPESATQTGMLVEENAYFPTGNVGLMYYVAHNLRYPTQARLSKTEGDVLVEFTVLQNGSIDMVRVDKSIDSACDQEAIRLVKKMPKWIPAKQMGKPIATVYLLPIRFTLK